MIFINADNLATTSFSQQLWVEESGIKADNEKIVAHHACCCYLPCDWGEEKAGLNYLLARSQHEFITSHVKVKIILFIFSIAPEATPAFIKFSDADKVLSI